MFTMRTAHAEQMLDDTRAVSAELFDALEEAEGIAERMDAAWEGASASARADSGAEWRDDARRMIAALDEMYSALSGAHGNYTAAVSANSSMWG